MSYVIGIPFLPKLSVNDRRYEGADIMAAAQDIFSGVDTQFYAVQPHLAAGSTGVDLGIDGNGGKHGIKGLVEALAMKELLNTLWLQ